MFAVPEVDDDTEVTSPTDHSKRTKQEEDTKESLSSISTPIAVTLTPTLTGASTTASERTDRNPTQSSSINNISERQQHRSRRTLFHRNTIHICDQIGDRM